MVTCGDITYSGCQAVHCADCVDVLIDRFGAVLGEGSTALLPKIINPACEECSPTPGAVDANLLRFCMDQMKVTRTELQALYNADLSQPAAREPVEEPFDSKLLRHCLAEWKLTRAEVLLKPREYTETSDARDLRCCLGHLGVSRETAEAAYTPTTSDNSRILRYCRGEVRSLCPGDYKWYLRKFGWTREDALEKCGPLAAETRDGRLLAFVLANYYVRRSGMGSVRKWQREPLDSKILRFFLFDVGMTRAEAIARHARFMR